MGKLEKIVVLTVLFLVAVILGVSLNGDRGVAAAGTGPGELGRATTAEAPARGPANTVEERAPSAASRRNTTPTSPVQSPAGQTPADDAPLGPKGALSAGVNERNGAKQGGRKRGQLQPAKAPATAPAEKKIVEEEAEPEEFILTLAGLEPSLAEDMMLYTWRDGDSFSALATRYYGSTRHVNRLLTVNEDVDETALTVGQRILVPVLPPQNYTPASPGAKKVEWEGGSTYVVQSGDVLGTISQNVYGTSKSWRKIYDANRDLLTDPNTLKVGMKLRIPE